jgi:hypothetical protein
VTRNHDHKTLAAIAAVFALPSREEQIEAACALAAREAHQDIRELFHLWSADARKAMSRADCMHEGAWGQTSQIEKEKSGALRSLLDGKKRLISTSSFYEHLVTRLILSHPVDGPAPRGTSTSTRFGARHPASGRAAKEAGAVS